MSSSSPVSLPELPRGIGRFVPPSDPLRDVFSSEVRETWRQSLNEDLLYRLEVLSACGPQPSDLRAALKLRARRAQKAAWETYLFTAFVCGMFEGARGNELRSRLSSVERDDFRSAMSECEVCWFLAGRMHMPVDALAPGRNGKNLDLRAYGTCGDIGVEVKAPWRERPASGAWHGDESDKIAQTMESANRQFDDLTPNLLVIVPELRTPMFSHRRDLLKAAFGQSMMTWQVNPKKGEYGPVEVKFQPDGKFLNTERPGGKLLKPDGFPGYRRISAILCIEERYEEKYPLSVPFFALDEELRHSLWPYWEHARDLHFSHENEAWIDHNVLVLHNPYAYHAISEELFREYPQLVPVGDEMQWTDGEEVIV